MAAAVEFSNNASGVAIAALNTPQLVIAAAQFGGGCFNLLEVDLSAMAGGDLVTVTFRRAATTTPAQPDLLLGTYSGAQDQPLKAFAPQAIPTNEDAGEYWIEQTGGSLITFDWFLRVVYQS